MKKRKTGQTKNACNNNPLTALFTALPALPLKFPCAGEIKVVLSPYRIFPSPEKGRKRRKWRKKMMKTPKKSGTENPESDPYRK